MVTNASVGVSEILEDFKSNIQFLEVPQHNGSLLKVALCGETSLHTAVRQGDVAEVRELILYGADMYDFDCNGLTPMDVAILLDKLEMIHTFLEYKFDVKAKFIKGNTVLHFAVVNGTERTVTALLQAGCTVDAVNNDDVTPLLLAVFYNKRSMFQILVNSGASINRLFSHSDTYLHKVTRIGDVHLVLFFINQKVNVDLANDFGETPLTIAVEANNPALINVLLASGAQFIRTNNQWETYIHIAVKYGCMNALRTLLKHGVLVDSRTLYDDTALSLAIKKNNYDMVTLLISHGANIKDTPNHGQTYLHLALQYNNFMAARTLLEAGFPVETKNSTGYTPIMTAIESNSTEGLELLKSFGVDIFQNGIGGGSLLHMAAQRGNVGAIKWFVQNGISVSMGDPRRSTPLHYAVYYNQFLATRELLDMGADVNAKDIYGRSPYSYAFEKRFVNIADLLISRGGF